MGQEPARAGVTSSPSGGWHKNGTKPEAYVVGSEHQHDCSAIGFETAAVAAADIGNGG